MRRQEWEYRRDEVARRIRHLTNPPPDSWTESEAYTMLASYILMVGLIAAAAVLFLLVLAPTMGY